MDNEEYEKKWFWEVDDGIYDLQNDLLIESLISVGLSCLEDAIFISYDFTKWMNQEVMMESLWGKE